ncbi:sigma-70 family RNA polymerase sigma factor [Anaerotignum lactatifermentans]|uniref:RNA polymerase sigma factor n=1 Tax=Anaerotignum lactatifermentans TaxID=160404 RepID=A0ABS2G6I2_9FIRM|nr:sigma-70 family RNA polymerase sigma factor [Anaerotignum lactatifermentans]MBM6828717.1 sigma-70 family RNA polymerase sigma factor [Anaerotignum lactatifermentans]MBM6877044.1 sigma-70 family RNA polymerase sigma factor [Anaerotignum lactatifermentans]MBM6950299.1 sigma-70 family RNA polymerase sigma factor [Anaerotignum lactatifermentans]
MEQERKSRETVRQIGEYVSENQARFYRLAFSYAREQQAALDIVQNAIVKALEHSEQLKHTEYMKTWFYRILVNESLNYLKKAGREEPREPEKMARLMEREAPEEGAQIHEMVLGLPEEMKTVVMLRFYEDMKLEDIARITGENLSKVKYRLYTGLEKLRKAMGKEAET